MAKLLKGISSKVSLTLGDWQQGQTEQQLGAEDVRKMSIIIVGLFFFFTLFWINCTSW